MLTPPALHRVELSPDAGIQYVSRFAGTRLVLVGDLMVDRYLRGRATRLSPEAPVPVVEVEGEEYVLGGMGNTCLNASALGAAVYPVGVVGEDEPGDEVLRMLSARQIATDGVLRDPARHTTVKTRLIADNQQVVRVDLETRKPISDGLADRVIARVAARMAWASGLVVSDYLKGVLTEHVLSAIISMARQQGKPVFVDPKHPDFRRYRLATVITPNLKEAAAGSGIPIESERDLLPAAAALKAITACDNVLLTLGDAGMVLYDSTDTLFFVETAARQVFDVTGAGDTAIAAFSVAASSGVPMPAAMALSNLAAGLAVEREGTAQVSARDLLNELRRLKTAGAAATRPPSPGPFQGRPRPAESTTTGWHSLFATASRGRSRLHSGGVEQ